MATGNAKVTKDALLNSARQPGVNDLAGPARHRRPGLGDIQLAATSTVRRSPPCDEVRHRVARPVTSPGFPRPRSHLGLLGVAFSPVLGAWGRQLALMLRSVPDP
jgi:hypothetical protein